MLQAGGSLLISRWRLGEIIIEYAGEVIRPVLTDKREQYYDSRGIGCYMFRVDDRMIVDATLTGNAARFVNHSCQPNCASRIVKVEGHKHIVIFAERPIAIGQELTYDYKVWPFILAFRFYLTRFYP